MPARLTAYLPDHAAASCLLRTQERVRVGRGHDCEFHLDHPSISRVHAELTRVGGRWRITDLGSKNGCFLDGERVTSSVLEQPSWLRLGDILCEFAPLSKAAADNFEHRISVKRNSAMMLVERLEQQTSFPDLLAATVHATVELAGCERGFLLLAKQGLLEVVASYGLDPASLRFREFQGSIGAAQRALVSGEPVVLNDISADAELAKRPSVIAGGLRTLICLPLRDQSETIGLVYADSQRAGAVITAIDHDLLRAFAERAALWIIARRDIVALSNLAPPTVSWSEILTAQQMASA